jgi:hypothetical protein
MQEGSAESFNEHQVGSSLILRCMNSCMLSAACAAVGTVLQLTSDRVIQRVAHMFLVLLSACTSSGDAHQQAERLRRHVPG